MKYRVNENCIGCGLCEAVCPEVFRLNGDQAAARDVDTDAPEAVDAMQGCPVQAIEER